MKKSLVILILLVVGSVVALLTMGAGCTSVNGTQSTQEAYFPEPTNYVVDSAGVLDPSTVTTLNETLKNFDGTAQIAVAVIDTTAPYSIEQYGIKLADKWKVGYEGRDNGAIIILAVQDRKVRLEIGKGLEGDITDGQAGEIVDTAMIPYLKNNDWDNALISGVNAIIQKLNK